MDFAALSRNIKSARDAAGLTQDQAADAADMQPAVYLRIERGEVDPRLSSLVRIAGALGMNASELLRDASQVLRDAKGTGRIPRRPGR